MPRGKRPVRGGKRPIERGKSKFSKPKKQKKGKFNLHEASYVKERDAKNAEIENRRNRLEQEELKKRKYESETSEDEELEDPMKTLLSTFSSNISNKKRIAIESESESEESSSDEEKLLSQEEKEAESPSDKQIPSLQPSNEEEDEEDEKEGGEDEKEEEKDEKEDKNPIIDEETIEIKQKEEDEEDEETSREDSGIINDPFTLHLAHDIPDDLHRLISTPNPAPKTQKLSWPTLGNLFIQIPETPRNSSSNPLKPSILDPKKFVEPGKLPASIDHVDWTNLHIKSQIHSNLTRANYPNIADSLSTASPSPLTPLQKELFSIINNYQDLLYCERTFANEEEIRFVYCLHAINHLLKTRTKILHHNAKLSKSNGEVPEEYRDQGLVRPKVLILVPFRHSCLKIVELLISILIGEDKGGQVVNKKRFLEDFGAAEIMMPKKNPKPEDYEMTFRGNTDDSFKIGLSLTKKTLKLYSEFYSSDIIISSVLGLRMLVGAEGEEDRDFDFLSSIELLIMDQTELFFMQNWDHLVHVMDHFHLQPKKSHETDFSRVRSWCVNGWSKYYRQTLIFSGIKLPEIQGIFSKKCWNYAGKVRIMNSCKVGSVCEVIVQVPQVFHKFNATCHQRSIDARMEFFVGKILPEFKDSIMNHTLIFVPSYFDYVKLRNYFKKEEMNFVQICEYTKDAKVARARDMFYHSDAHFLIYSERFHFFRRIRVKGIRHLIFFAPPNFPNFYSEMCNLMLESNQNPKAGNESNMTVTTLYSKYDAMQLAEIVGSEKAGRMIASDKNVHMIMTGE